MSAVQCKPTRRHPCSPQSFRNFVPSRFAVHYKNFSNDISKIFENFYYISADRLGPTKYEEKTELDVLNPIGQNGQFRLNVLNNKKDICDKISNDINMIMDFNDKLKIVKG